MAITDPAQVERGLFLVFIVTCTFLFSYVIYQRFLHPLSHYKGPFLASVTDLWQVLQYLTQKQAYRLTKLHEKYGPIVRYGPDKISVTYEEAIPLLYPKSGGTVIKTDFYDAFGGLHPNLFGLRDEAEHSKRRRYLSHSYSMAYIKQLEQFLDLNIKFLTDKISSYATDGKAFDLSELIQFYIVDVLGELAFSQSFGLQETGDASRGPRVAEHVFLASTIGAWPAMTATLRRWLPWVPLGSLQRLLGSRQKVIDMARECVGRRLQDLEQARQDDVLAAEQRKDILTNLILARDPDTKERLSRTLLETESFGFIIAGTHTTSGTINLLLWNLFHSPEALAQCVAEIDESMPELSGEEPAYSVAAAEASLPYLRKCVKENFRTTPVFTMPLARRVLEPAGISIAGHHFPQGTSIAVCNHAFHHNAAVWGNDHNVFDPDRWDDKELNERSKLLMHFGLGHRQCIGKTMALTNIYKVTSTLLKMFSFDLADEEERSAAAKGAFKGVLPDMISVGISDLAGPLMVKATKRASTEKL